MCIADCEHCACVHGVGSFSGVEFPHASVGEGWGQVRGGAESQAEIGGHIFAEQRAVVVVSGEARILAYCAPIELIRLHELEELRIRREASELVKEVIKHRNFAVITGHAWVGKALMLRRRSVKQCLVTLLRSDRLHYLFIHGVRERAAMICPPVRRPSTRELSGEDVDGLVQGEQISPVSGNALPGFRIGEDVRVCIAGNDYAVLRSKLRTAIAGATRGCCHFDNNGKRNLYVEQRFEFWYGSVIVGKELADRMLIRGPVGGVDAPLGILRRVDLDVVDLSGAGAISILTAITDDSIIRRGGWSGGGLRCGCRRCRWLRCCCRGWCRCCCWCRGCCWFWSGRWCWSWCRSDRAAGYFSDCQHFHVGIVGQCEADYHFCTVESERITIKVKRPAVFSAACRIAVRG